MRWRLSVSQSAIEDAVLCLGLAAHAIPLLLQQCCDRNGIARMSIPCPSHRKAGSTDPLTSVSIAIASSYVVCMMN